MKKSENFTKLAILGYQGSIGKRYAIIADYLKIDWVGLEIDDSLSPLNDCSHCLIATPTDTHFKLLRYISEAWKHLKILCEKPYATKIEEIEEIEKLIDSGKNINMVLNYAYCPYSRLAFSNETKYISHHSGNDGLDWDCIQLHHLAQTEPKLEIGPIWECFINGNKITLEDVNKSYVFMLWEFINDQYRVDNKKVIKTHKRIYENLNRNTSQN